MRAQLRLIPFSVTDVPHYCHCLRDVTERMERSRHPRSGLARCSWELVQRWTGDTIRCETVREPIGEEPALLVPGQNELPVPARCSEVEMAQVRSRWGLLG